MRRTGTILLGIAAIVTSLCLIVFWNKDDREESAGKLYEETDTGNGLAGPSEELPASQAKGSPRGREIAAEPIHFLQDGQHVEDVKDPKMLRNYGHSDGNIESDLRLVLGTLQHFWQWYRDPDLLLLGGNADVLTTLMGRNPEGVAFVESENPFVDERGELLDRWGTPLFFHPESVTRIEIRSSGPDRVRFTEDDVFLFATSAAQPKR